MKDLGFIFISVLLIGGLILWDHHHADLQFTPGTYSVTEEGFHGPISLDVTFSEDKLTDITVLDQHETEEIGKPALPIISSRIIEAQGLRVDAVSGATVSSEAVKAAVKKAAQQAGVSDMQAFCHNKAFFKRPKQIEDSWDIVVIGGGGAGMMAAAQAAQDGNTVLVIEKNADLGGNTVVSGGFYQSVLPYLVWNPEDPESNTGIGDDGQSYPKAKMVNGCLATLRSLLNWSEAPFDAEYYRTHPFVAGNTDEQAKHGVHAEYLQTLRALKGEIRTYLAWADKQLRQGKQETQLTLFSTNNLHIFQTYYGGVRPSADGTEWCYGDAALVRQFIEEGQLLKPWLTGMGVEFIEAQSTIVGALWYRAMGMKGAHVIVDGKSQWSDGKYGAYIMAPLCAMKNAHPHNQVLTLTSAQDLIFENGRVVGVNALCEDGTKVKAHATKGVILATGGYAANLQKVIESNKYWKPSDLRTTTKTTNRSSLQGDGIWMSQAIGADVTGMGWTQLLPLSYAQTGNIAFGTIDDAVFISPKTGKRYVDEMDERDVLSIAAFDHGVEMLDACGVYYYIVGDHDNATKAGPAGVDAEWNQYTLKVAELPALFAQLHLPTDATTVISTLRAFDQAILRGQEPADAPKRIVSQLIGNIERRADGSYDAKTYDLENTTIRFRVLAPATHHTMGGLKIDMQRHVLDTHGNPIPGLFAAGEVTGGIHGGNRLGGNALTEIMVSGRIAAKAANQ